MRKQLSLQEYEEMGKVIKRIKNDINSLYDLLPRIKGKNSNEMRLLFKTDDSIMALSSLLENDMFNAFPEIDNSYLNVF